MKEPVCAERSDGVGEGPVAGQIDVVSHQIESLVRLGYPGLVGVTEETFRSRLRTLADTTAPVRNDTVEPATGRVPVVLVVTSAAVATSTMLALARRRGLQPVEKLYPRQPDYFQPLDEVRVPDADAYLLFGLERGDEYLNVTPDDALAAITARGRTPLTIEEGVALLTHYPELLQSNRCFSLLASRGDDRRVPALWLSDRRPKLGWCWAGNPHSWLGSASADGRSPGVWFRR